MVTRIKHVGYSLIVLVVCLLITAQSHAADFTASIDRNTVTRGEGFRLDLSLSGASPNGDPNFFPLEKDFKIVSREQSSQTTIINTHVSSSINWQLVLIAPKEGDYVIPPITVNTDSGLLKSNKLEVTVGKGSATAPQAGAAGNTIPQALSVKAGVSNPVPYQNEPVLYTVKLIAARGVGNISLPEFTVPDAVIEKLGDAKDYNSSIGGHPVKVIEARYLITPLKAGKITIPSYIFQGQIASNMRRKSNSFFNDPFFNMPDPFDKLPGLGGFATYEPFEIAGDEISLDVKPPAAKMDPWLPLYDLQVADSLSGKENAKVGEPLTLTLTQKADGASGKVLPNLEPQIMKSKDFKIYADKPEVGEDVSTDGKSISGWRKESYTMIPQKSGNLVLPEILVPWWNISKGKGAQSRVPASTISVANSAISDEQTAAQKPNITSPGNMKAASASEQSVSPVTKTQQRTQIAAKRPNAQVLPKWLGTLLGSMGIIILILLGLIIYFWRKTQRQENKDKTAFQNTVKPADVHKISLYSIKEAKTPEDLKKVLQLYAHQQFGTSSSASLLGIYHEMVRQGLCPEIASYKKHFKDLDAALYANQEISLDDIKVGFMDILKSKPHKIEINAAKMHNINPS